MKLHMLIYILAGWLLFASGCQPIVAPSENAETSQNRPSPADEAGYSEERAALALTEVEALMVGTHYYVSPEGDNDNDGLTAETPFETILQAMPPSPSLARQRP